MRAALILASALLALGACHIAADAERGQDEKGSERVVRRDYRVGSFDKVALAGSPHVVVTVGGAPAVRAEGDAEMLDRLEIHVRNGELRIGSKKNRHGLWGFSRDPSRVTIYVTVPVLAGAAIGGSGDIRIDRVEGNVFTGSIGGSGDLRIDAMRVGEAHFSVAGSGGITASGSADRATMSIAGSGDIEAGGLQSRSARVSVVGSGDVRARATEAADVSVTGSGDVELAGGAECKVHKMGSGDIRCTG